MNKNISELKMHPLNAKIYGDGCDNDLLESIRKVGIISPLIITKDGTVISGHRRLNACYILKITEVPVMVSDATDENDIEEILILANRQRSKTNEQIGREANHLLLIEQNRAKERQRCGQGGILLPENFPEAKKGESRDIVGQKLGVSGKTAEKASEVIQIADALEVSGETEKANAIKETLNKSVDKAYREVKPIIEDKKAMVLETKKNGMTVESLPDGLHIITSSNPNYKPVMNATNDSIEWAKWTWNPVTGCLHDCPYCYARSMAENSYYADAFPTGFKPAFHPGRLSAPANTKIPTARENETCIRNVFVCSMADLFGEWVPAEWIQKVIDIVTQTPDFNFLFLTKNPKRYLEFYFPENAWLGSSADTNKRYEIALNIFSDLEMMRDEGETDYSIGFLSCEPLSEHIGMKAEQNELTDDVYHLPFEWIIIGGFKDGKQPAWEWVENILKESRKANCKIYFKPNLTIRPMEYPE